MADLEERQEKQEERCTMTTLHRKRDSLLIVSEYLGIRTF